MDSLPLTPTNLKQTLPLPGGEISRANALSRPSVDDGLFSNFSSLTASPAISPNNPMYGPANTSMLSWLQVRLPMRSGSSGSTSSLSLGEISKQLAGIDHGVSDFGTVDHARAVFDTLSNIHTYLYRYLFHLPLATSRFDESNAVKAVDAYCCLIGVLEKMATITLKYELQDPNFTGLLVKAHEGVRLIRVNTLAEIHYHTDVALHQLDASSGATLVSLNEQKLKLEQKMCFMQIMDGKNEFKASSTRCLLNDFKSLGYYLAEPGVNEVRLLGHLSDTLERIEQALDAYAMAKQQDCFSAHCLIL